MGNERAYLETRPATEYARGFSVRLEGALERCAEIVEGKWLWCLAAFSVLYWAATWKTAATKPLWIDEIITRHLAVLPTWSELWRALRMGTDQQPPLFYLLTRWTGSGGEPIGLRLPAMVGMWVASLCLCAFVSRRTSRVCGMIAMLMPFLLGSSRYAYEARPYGLLLGSAAAMLLCWQMVADGFHRKLAMALLWASAAVTVSAHYLGGLALAPIAVGEIARWRRNGKLDLPVWAALAGAVPPLLLALPLIREIQADTVRFWAPPALASIPDFYKLMFWPAATFTGALLIAALVSLLLESGGAWPKEKQRGAWADIGATAAFAASPFLYVLVCLKLGSFVPRYAVVSLLGVCAGIAFLVAGRRALALAVLLLAAAHFTAAEAGKLMKTEMPRQPHLPQDSQSAKLPVVMSGPNEYIETQYYAPPELALRLYYIADPALALRYWGSDAVAVDKSCQRYARWLPLQVVSYADFLAAHPRFLMVYRQREAFGWILQKLYDDGATMTLRTVADDERVYEVLAPTARR